jgi:glutamate-5-semialdehyde dehydrogenase
LLIDRGADGDRIAAVIDASLDRKVCNTVNVVGLPTAAGDEWAAAAAGAVVAAKRRRGRLVVHCRVAERDFVSDVFSRTGAEVTVIEHTSDEFLATEWEWDEDPEVSVIGIDDVEEGTRLFNRYSPQFVVSIVSSDPRAVEKVYEAANAPFVGDGFTRWVDGQYALNRPELGLSNWQSGRLFARGGILSGDGVFSVRYVARHTDPTQRR